MEPANGKPTPATPPPAPDLEIKDAAVIFNPIWEDLEAHFGREHLRFPKEIILLGGAPGSGKGTHTAFISRTRGLTCTPIVMSALLDTPEMKRVKDAGNMIGDREVFAVLLRQLLKPEFRDGVILDGFPRTKVQVECLKMLYEKMTQLWREFYGTPHWPSTSASPSFRSSCSSSTSGRALAASSSAVRILARTTKK